MKETRIVDIKREQGVTICYDLRIKDAENEIFISNNSEYIQKLS